jgi:hypothetical protein
MSTFYDLNDLIAKHKDNISFLLISKQIGKTKPATLFFISKFGCEIEKVIFYNQLTKNKIWDEFDVLLTSNPELLLQTENKTLIKYETSYNLTTDFYTVSLVSLLRSTPTLVLVPEHGVV